jgi:alpha-2-macroglobulin
LVISSLEQLLLQPNLQERINNEILSLLLFAAIDNKDNSRILKYFELVKEKDPSLIIPFEKIPPIQLAYREQQAFEGGYHLSRGVADATFMSEVRGVGVLEDNKEVAEALALFRNLLSEYPDTALTAKARYAFAQAIYDRADKITSGETILGFDRKGLLHEVVLLMGDFLARFPSDPEAPAAIFSTASALLENDQANLSVAWSDVGLRQHAKSDLAPAIAYLKAFAHFKLGQYDRSLELCRQVAEQSTQEESRDMANYITAQIYHAQGDLKRAIESYRLVAQRFHDANETIQELEREQFEIPEVVSPSSAERPTLEMKLKNIGRVDLRAYQVDLMKLYLLKGSLRQLNEVNLAGIKPVFSRTLQYDTSRAKGLRTEKVPLDLPGKGAYLVLARAGSSLTHSLVLVGHLDCEVTEIEGEGRVRVTVRNDKGKPVGGARVELKGSNNDRFTAGNTDLRGIFLANDVQGEATVIASHQGLFGLYRGTRNLNLRTTPQPSAVDLNGNADNQQGMNYDFEDSVVQGELKNERKAAAKDFFKQAQETKGLAVEQAK